MKRLFFAALLFLPLAPIQFAWSQGPMISRASTITFFSHAPLEDIEAVNRQTSAALDLEKGELVVKMLIRHFEFEKALMQEHFNENYMESEKYPSSVFQGKFTCHEPISAASRGSFQIQVSGELTIHGITHPVECPALIEFGEDQVNATAKFKVRPEDFGIKIPSVVVDNIAEEVEVTADLIFKPQN